MTASYDATGFFTRIHWTANTEADLAGYRVYRRLPGTPWPTKPLATTTSAWYRDLTTPIDGLTHYYDIRAVDTSGNESLPSTGTPVTTAVLGAPAGVTATGVDTGITVTWAPVPGAAKYALYRGPVHSVPGEFVGFVTGTSHTDTGVERSVPWQYKVRAVDASGYLSAPSEVSNDDYRLVAAPLDLRAEPGVGAAYLEWTYDYEHGGEVYGYDVYRSRTLPVDTTTEPVRCLAVGSTDLGDGRRTVRCADSSLARGETYHYVVKYKDNSGRQSVASPSAMVTTLTEDTVPPADVTGLTAKVTEYGVVLDWAAGTERDLSRYLVSRGTTVTGVDGRESCSVTSTEAVLTSVRHYTDANVANGERLCYAVAALDTSQNRSDQDGTTTTRFVQEFDLTPSVQTPEGSPVTITWSGGLNGEGYIGWNPVDGAQEYRVHRWNPATGSYEFAESVSAFDVFGEPESNPYFEDYDGPSGTTVYYWVTAVLADGTETLPAGTAVAVVPD